MFDTTSGLPYKYCIAYYLFHFLCCLYYRNFFYAYQHAQYFHFLWSLYYQYVFDAHQHVLTRSIPFQRAFTKRLTPATISYKIIFIYTIRRVTYIFYIVFHSCDFSNAFESFYSYTEVNEESLTNLFQRLNVRKMQYFLPHQQGEQQGRSANFLFAPETRSKGVIIKLF